MINKKNKNISKDIQIENKDKNIYKKLILSTVIQNKHILAKDNLVQWDSFDLTNSIIINVRKDEKKWKLKKFVKEYHPQITTYTDSVLFNIKKDKEEPKKALIPQWDEMPLKEKTLLELKKEQKWTTYINFLNLKDLSSWQKQLIDSKKSLNEVETIKNIDEIENKNELNRRKKIMLHQHLIKINQAIIRLSLQKKKIDFKKNRTDLEKQLLIVINQTIKSYQNLKNKYVQNNNC